MNTRCSAILLMAGIGSRLGSPTPKQFHLLGSKKIYLHTLETFLTSELFQQIILVCHPEWINEVENEIPQDPKIVIIPGGPTRQSSSLLGLKACNRADFVMIHDAVRPFVSQEILERNIAAVQQHRAVDTCIPSADTIVRTKNGEFISSIPHRKDCQRGQTPQTFDYQLIFEAHQKTQAIESTDDCSLVLELGHSVAIVSGSEDNLKITTEMDVEIAEWMLSKRQTAALKNLC